jgi:cytochrome c peroxidase
MTGGRESSRWASRRGAWMAAAVLAFGGIGFAAPRQTTRAFDGSDVRRLVIAQADSLDASLAALRDALSTASGSSSVDGPPPGVRLAFRRARAQYKHVEGVVEFYAPALAAAFNSRRQEVDDDDAPPPSLLAPSGFPVLESLLWPSEGSIPTRTSADSGRRLVDAMRPLVGRVRGLATGIQPTDAQVIELTRLELVRVTTLGIAGFDAPRSRDAMAECAEALDGIRELYMVVGGRWPAAAARRRQLDASLSAASANLRTHADFTTFDRLDFLVGYANAAAAALASLRLTVGIVPLIMPRGLRATAVSPYAAAAFDVRAYAPRSAPSESPVLIELGERLFGDPRLSGPRTRSCASCHVPSRAFADGRATPATLVPGMRVPRNTPTLINVGLEPAQFADERAVSLEDQVVEVLRSRAEMASSIETAATRVAADRDYRARFSHAFGAGDRKDDSVSVTPLRVRQALAAYERSLVGMSSRFDRAVRGDASAITAEERRGFNLFMGKAGCGSCHFAPLFSGVAPPLYVASDVEVIGTPAAPNSVRFDADSGRGAIDHRADHVRAFKVPSLRNVAITAPYMHNGTFLTLRQVMDFYEGGGAHGRLSNQTLATDSLHLTPSERDAVIAFLQALTDSSVRSDRVKMNVPDNHTSP